MKKKVLLVLAGGIALGAYQAGAYAALHEHEELWPARLAGSSVGAVNAALIAGNPPEVRLARLQAFWNEIEGNEAPAAEPPGWRHAASWMSVLQTRVLGQAGHFRPRFPDMLLSHSTSVYDLAPLRQRIERLVDFERLNAGSPRLSVVTTDIETGDEVVFDTCNGTPISSEHLVASCGLPPDFAPMEIGGRLLGDGGLVANAPIDTVLRDEESNGDLVCFVVDLFSARGARPSNLQEAAARRMDLLFANQTRRAIESVVREYRFRARHPKLRILHLAYRATADEAGAEKPFDYSRHALSARWDAGYRDMKDAIAIVAGNQQNGERVSVFDLY